MRRQFLKIDTGRTYIMGVLNVTPDSFYDKGRFFDKEKAVGHAIDMAREGADIIDVGGESTRPGAEDVDVERELGRVIPVVRAISERISVSISIDTRKAKVAEEALKAGACIVNDVSALNYDPGMAAVIAKYGAICVLTHMKGSPKDMQVNPAYGDVVKEIISTLEESIKKAKSSGITADKIIIDPGIGFGKTLEHNIEILKRLDEFKRLGYPICVGTSRKSFIGKMLNSDDSGDRLAGTLATCAIAVMKGAKILRVHDVKETVQAARVADSVIKSGKN
ncbi:MAG: dihydropteroate synthase [Omnitrophica bacterium RIFCSPHIGHO2_02_FULL_46_20]|nr:MAG: dihydropteroate synthase [Omnitrophica bacterium RIFCSPHIGHO2_02_FULL_46_20]